MRNFVVVVLNIVAFPDASIFGTTFDAVAAAFAPVLRSSRSTTRCKLPKEALVVTRRSGSKWDNLIDEDEGPPVPPDMKYVPRNIMRQHENFVAIREAGGKELTNDIYVREPGSGVFWFAGKVARVSDVSLAQCIARQWPLVEQHAANLRPIELYPHRGQLEIWTAPGDSELDVAYNRPSIVFEKCKREVEGAAAVKNSFIGFQGEVYQQGEEGFRTWRTEDGRPANPEVQSAETRPPTDEEMEELEKKLEGQDLNALYEEQQRREGQEL